MKMFLDLIVKYTHIANALSFAIIHLIVSFLRSQNLNQLPLTKKAVNILLGQTTSNIASPTSTTRTAITRSLSAWPIGWLNATASWWTAKKKRPRVLRSSRMNSISIWSRTPACFTTFSQKSSWWLTTARRTCFWPHSTVSTGSLSPTTGIPQLVL